MLTTRLALGAAPVLVALLLTGCTEDASTEEPTPEEVLAQAKDQLDATPGVRISLATEDLPAGVAGILGAEGVGTHAPAFEGTLRVSVSGIAADAEVVAVDGQVHAKLPFRTDFVVVDPADYGAPDPAALMDPEQGLSSLLTEAEDVREGEQQRQGEDVLTAYHGTLPGTAVARIIPSAQADSAFDATFAVTEDDLLREAVLTGPFYPDAGEVTYTVRFEEYGVERDISAP